ncbi:hypothetical protein SAMN05216284_116178 [Micromonospora sediminimaris]|nr:hypothetical protein SAMN05216284_116178 [Micromonospora sediminimaris]
MSQTPCCTSQTCRLALSTGTRTPHRAQLTAVHRGPCGPIGRTVRTELESGWRSPTRRRVHPATRSSRRVCSNPPLFDTGCLFAIGDQHFCAHGRAMADRGRAPMVGQPPDGCQCCRRSPDRPYAPTCGSVSISCPHAGTETSGWHYAVLADNRPPAMRQQSRSLNGGGAQTTTTRRSAEGRPPRKCDSISVDRACRVGLASVACSGGSGETPRLRVHNGRSSPRTGQARNPRRRQVRPKLCVDLSRQTCPAQLRTVGVQPLSRPPVAALQRRRHPRVAACACVPGPLRGV